MVCHVLPREKKQKRHSEKKKKIGGKDYNMPQFTTCHNNCHNFISDVKIGVWDFFFLFVCFIVV